jgi:DNA-directed RNA polymerase subunit RPC12/RpoP
LIDSHYVFEISSSLLRFSRPGPDRYNFRCPYCGDSDKDKTKARGNLKRSIKNPGELSYRCFNCGKHCLFSTLLKDHFPDTYRKYIFEKFSGKAPKEIDVDFWNNKKTFYDRPEFKKVLKLSDHFEPLSVIHWSHPARIYCDNRGIPEEMLNRLWWSEDFWTTCKTLSMAPIEVKQKEGRIIIPLIDPINGIIGVQGRAINKSKLRYATIQFKPGKMIFGRDNIITDHPVVILEGPFDTFFVENSIAICGAQNASEKDFTNCIWYLDQEPRNPQVVRKIKALAESGARVTLMPEKYQEKDPNELNLELKLSRSEITALAIRHSYQGMGALLKLTEWKRCR